MRPGFLLKTGWIFPFLFLLGCGTPAQSSALHAATIHTAATRLSYVSRANTDLSQFAGTWYAHGAVLTIASNGGATFEGRAYRWCGSGVSQPCDTIDARGYIHNGNHEQVQFSRVTGSTAYGTITSSSFHTVGMAVSVTLQPNGTLLYASNAPISLLCDPEAPVGMCGA